MNFRAAMGQRIRERRLSLGLSQESLAQAAGWGRHHLSRVELGQASTAAERLVSMAEALGCTVRELVPDLDDLDGMPDPAPEALEAARNPRSQRPSGRG